MLFVREVFGVVRRRGRCGGLGWIFPDVPYAQYDSPDVAGTAFINPYQGDPLMTFGHETIHLLGIVEKGCPYEDEHKHPLFIRYVPKA